MFKRQLILLSFVIWLTHFDGVHSQMTWDELYEFYRGISDSCYEKYPVDVQVLHDINTKRQFADGNDTLKCYINCIFQMVRFTKRGKFSTDWAVKSVKMYCPVDFVPEWVSAIETCRNEKGGENSPCEQSYVMAKCIARNNEKFKIAYPGMQNPYV